MLHVPEPLDVDAMDRACDTLIGRHDFGAFYTHRAEDDPPKGTLRRVSQTRWLRDGKDPRIVRFEIEADAFLRHMVRSIVGTALQVGQQKLSADGFARIFAGGNRSLAGPTAPPHGLTLLQVTY
jgi:tRNA pseudouridine38-40 synthase